MIQSPTASSDAGSDPPAIRIFDLVKRFATGVVALDGISLDVANGEFLAVLGASGCGKSTLLRIVAGLDQPSAGRVEVLGESPKSARMGRNFGVVFQDPALLPWRTVRQNVELPADIFHNKEMMSRAAEWIRRVGLAGFEDALPAHLSGGMRSRVAIARALSFRPSFLLMDEPFGALDELTRSEMQDELLHLWDEYRPTVVFITHSVTEALFLADRVVVMTPRPGRVFDIVSSDFERPRSRHLLGDPTFAKTAERLLSSLTG